VEPHLRGAVDVVRVVEHQARLVRVPEILEADDLHLIARTAVVQVVDDLSALVERRRASLRKRLGRW
jgi:hypothetical protein